MSFLYNREHLVMGKRKCTFLLIASILVLQDVHIVRSEASTQDDGIGDSTHRLLDRRRQTITTTRNPIPNTTENQNFLRGILNIFNPFNFNYPGTRDPGSITTPGYSAALDQTPAPGETAAVKKTLDASQNPARGQTVAPGNTAVPGQSTGLGKTVTPDQTTPEYNAVPDQSPTPGQTASSGETTATGQTAESGHTVPSDHTAGLAGHPGALGQTASPNHTADPVETVALRQTVAPGQSAGPVQTVISSEQTSALRQTTSSGHATFSGQTSTSVQNTAPGQTTIQGVTTPGHTSAPGKTAGSGQRTDQGQTASEEPNNTPINSNKIFRTTTTNKTETNWFEWFLNPFNIFGRPSKSTIITLTTTPATESKSQQYSGGATITRTVEPNSQQLPGDYTTGLIVSNPESTTQTNDSPDLTTTKTRLHLRTKRSESSNWLDAIFNPFGIFNSQSETTSTPRSINGSKQEVLVADITTSADIPQSKDSETTSRTATTKSSDWLDAFNPFNMFNPQPQITTPTTTLDPSLPPGGRGFSGLAYNIMMVIENVVDLLADLLLINDDWEPGYEQKRIEAITTALKAIVDIIVQSDQTGGLGSIWDRLFQIWDDLGELIKTFTYLNPVSMLGLPIIGANILNDLGNVASFFSLNFPTPTPGKRRVKKIEIDHTEFQQIIAQTERLVENLLYIEAIVENQFPDDIILQMLGNIRESFEKALEESKKTGHPIVLGTIQNLFPTSFIAQIIAEIGKALCNIEFAPVQIIGAILQQQLPINLGLSAIQMFVSPMFEGIERVIGQFIDDISSRLLKLDPNHAILNIIKTSVSRTGSFGKYLAELQNITGRIQLNFTEGYLLWQVFNFTFHFLVEPETIDFIGNTIEQILKLIPLDYLNVLPNVIASLAGDVISLSSRFMYRFIMTLGYIFFPSITTPAPDIGNITTIF